MTLASRLPLPLPEGLLGPSVIKAVGCCGALTAFHCLLHFEALTHNLTFSQSAAGVAICLRDQSDSRVFDVTKKGRVHCICLVALKQAHHLVEIGGCGVACCKLSCDRIEVSV